MRPAYFVPAAALVLVLGGCGDGGVAASESSTGASSSSSTGTGTSTPTTGEVTSSSTEPTLTGDGSDGGSSSSSGAPDTTGEPTGSTGSSTGAETSSSSSSSSGASSTGGSTGEDIGTTGTTGTTDADTSTGDSGSTGDTETGGEPVMDGFLALSGNDRLVRLDLAAAQAQLPSKSLLPHADYPYDMKIKPDGSEVWIVGAVGNGVKVVDTATGEITQQINLQGTGDYPVDVLFNVDGSLAYVSARDSNAVVVIDAATYAVQSTIALGVYNGGKMTLDPCSGKIFMVDWFDKSLLVVDPGLKKVTPILLGTSLWDLVLDPVSERLYVADRGSDKVHVFATDTMQFMSSVVVGDDPWGIDLSSDGGLLVVACEDDHTLHFIDTDTLTGTSMPLPADADPRDVAITADDLRAYVPTGTIAGADGVYEIDLLGPSLTATVLAGASDLDSNVVAVRPQPVACP